MPRFKVKAFDPHNADVAARTHWERLQRGETKHEYDLPPTRPGKRNKRGRQQQQPAAPTQHLDDERPSLSQRRFQAQIAAAAGTALKQPKSAPDTELRDKRTIRKDKRAKKAEIHEHDEREEPSVSKRRRTQTEEERQAEEQHTRAQWEDKVAAIQGKRSKAPTASAPPPSPPSPPAREFAGVEHIPFGTQVDRPPQHLPQPRNKRAAAAGSGVSKAAGPLSMEQYAAERQKAQEAYAEMRKRRREADKT